MSYKIKKHGIHKKTGTELHMISGYRGDGDDIELTVSWLRDDLFYLKVAGKPCYEAVNTAYQYETDFITKRDIGIDHKEAIRIDSIIDLTEIIGRPPISIAAVKKISKTLLPEQYFGHSVIISPHDNRITKEILNFLKDVMLVFDSKLKLTVSDTFEEACKILGYEISAAHES